MDVSCIWEHNGADTLLHCTDFPGAFARGASLDEALEKLPSEIRSYAVWAGLELDAEIRPVISFEKLTGLQIRDADSDVLFPQEQLPLSEADYLHLKTLALKSARDFQALYDSLPDKDRTVLPSRATFYGAVPTTGSQMYAHTKSVNAYYFAEIGVDADGEGTICQCRERGFAALEQQPGFLENRVFEGSYGETWSLRKVVRRFLWHDRIHARAMYRMAVKTFGAGSVPDIFYFAL